MMYLKTPRTTMRPSTYTQDQLEAIFAPSDNEPPTRRDPIVAEALAERERGLPHIRRVGT